MFVPDHRQTDVSQLILPMLAVKQSSQAACPLYLLWR